MNTRTRESNLLARIFAAQQIDQTCKHWCYAAQGFAVVTRTDRGFSTRLPGQRKAAILNQDEAIAAIVAAHHGAD